MNTLRTGATALGIATLLAVPTALVPASPANADVERGGAAARRYELNVDRERGGFEVAPTSRARPREAAWRIVLKHDGKRYFTRHPDHRPRGRPRRRAFPSEHRRQRTP